MNTFDGEVIFTDLNRPMQDLLATLHISNHTRLTNGTLIVALA
jgi:hypothetical protein